MQDKTYTKEQSSTVRRIKYLPEEKILEVEFTDGAVYHYLEVFERKAKAAFESEKIGHFIAKEIKGFHEYKKIN